MIMLAVVLGAWLLITLSMWADETTRQDTAARAGDVLLDGWELLPPCLV